MNVDDWIDRHRRVQNMVAAARNLELTPQERHAYNHHLRNIEGGGYKHGDGSVSSYLAMMITIDDELYSLPTVWGNELVSETEAVKRAKADGLYKWPKYRSVEDADRRYMDMHRYMRRDTREKLNASTVSEPSRDHNGSAVEGDKPTVSPRDY